MSDSITDISVQLINKETFGAVTVIIIVVLLIVILSCGYAFITDYGITEAFMYLLPAAVAAFLLVPGLMKLSGQGNDAGSYKPTPVREVIDLNF